MPNFNVNSPFSSISQQMFSPRHTAASVSGGLGELSRAFNMNALAKTQDLNRGLSQNVGAMHRGQGTHDARAMFVPLQQRMQDANANAQWGLGVQNANEAAGLQGMNMMMGQELINRNRNINLLSLLFNPADLFGL